MTKPTDLVQGTLDLLILKDGKNYLKQEQANWDRLSAAIGLVLKNA